MTLIFDLLPWIPFHQCTMTCWISVQGPFTEYRDITSRETGIDGRTCNGRTVGRTTRTHNALRLTGTLKLKNTTAVWKCFVNSVIHWSIVWLTWSGWAWQLTQFPRYNMTSYGRWAFSYADPHAWNSLPEHLRQTTSIELFKRSLKTFLFGQISRSVH